jgi:hypothetical protein
MIIVGCEPSTHYGNLNDLPSTGQRPSRDGCGYLDP